MLGELYVPKGLALETAQAVLETELVYACNVAYGCSNACLYCLLGNTYVAVDGQTKLIRDVKVGNRVVSFDGIALQFSEVKEVFKRPITAENLLVIQFENGAKILCTSEHPFFVGGEWKCAEDLQEGDECWFADYLEIRSLRSRTHNPMQSEKSRLAVSLSKIGAKNPMFKPKIEKDCKMCGKKFYVIPARKQKALFCSHSCAGKFRMLHNNPMKLPQVVAKVSRWFRGRPNLKIRGRKRQDASEYMKNQNPMWKEEAKRKALWNRKARKPTSIESLIIQVSNNYRLPLTYTGNFSHWIGDRLNPDFLVDGQNKVIEVYDPEFNYKTPRNDSWEKNRAELYAHYGYDVLFLKVRSKQRDWDDRDIAKSIRAFVSNGLKVIKVRKPNWRELSKAKENGRLFVYNLHCEPHNNYFVARNYREEGKWLLVHNCYVPRFTRRRRCNEEVRLPQKAPVDLVKHQFEKQWRFHWTSKLGVFLSFLTDPFLPKVKAETDKLISYLLDQGVTVATLSKLGFSEYYGRHGMTIVSLDSDFWMKFEPNTMPPLRRIETLEQLKGGWHEYVWISMEPYPPSAIHKQNLQDLLDELSFVDLIIFGMWNYDARARTEQARQEYAENVQILTDFCKENNIRVHVKSDTLKFIAKEK